MKRLLYLSIFLSFFLVLTHYSESEAVTLPWSTTYNCPDWLSYGNALNCDNLKKGGNWTDSCGHDEQVIAAANYPNGGGGKGQRHWIGNGVNSNSGGLKIEFTGVREFWIRFYFRYQAGFKWTNLAYQKLVYVNPSGAGTSAPVFTLYGYDKVGIDTQLNQPNYNTAYIASSAGTGWTNMMGSTTSDGSWHLYESHLKMDTNGSNGVVEIWIDDVKVANASNVNFRGNTNPNPWTVVLIGSNQRTPANATCMYLDFDDVAISNTGRIGPVGGASTPPPTTPNTPSNFQLY